MPDYIYLLENRLSADQQNALRQLREAAREAGMILFLTGDAVRDLTSGHAVRELEVSVHGNALKLQNIVEKLGGKVWGESETSRTLLSLIHISRGPPAQQEGADEDFDQIQRRQNHDSLPMRVDHPATDQLGCKAGAQVGGPAPARAQKQVGEQDSIRHPDRVCLLYTSRCV